MSNTVALSFSVDETKIDLQTPTGVEKKSIRELELSMLKDLCEYCAAINKSMKVVVAMLNVLDDLAVIGDAATLTITNDDALAIREAFEKLEMRPNGWLRHCKPIIRQLAKVEKCA